MKMNQRLLRLAGMALVTATQTVSANENPFTMTYLNHGYAQESHTEQIKDLHKKQEAKCGENRVKTQPEKNSATKEEEVKDSTSLKQNKKVLLCCEGTCGD